jgi:hypothetical protein
MLGYYRVPAQLVAARVVLISTDVSIKGFDLDLYCALHQNYVWSALTDAIKLFSLTSCIGSDGARTLTPLKVF